MDISVVVPSKDSTSLPRSLAVLSAAVARVAPIEVEVIVVDSSSGELRIPLELQDVCEVTLIRKDLGLLAARIDGICRSRGNWILNLDSDQLVHPDLLQALLKTHEPAIVIPETSAITGRWERLVSRSHEHIWERFRSKPSLDTPVIPRWYARTPLLSAVSSIITESRGRDGARLPTRHEDTILFSYFLKANNWLIGDCVGFVDVPIYHPILPLEQTAKKIFRYGSDMGIESQRFRHGRLNVDEDVWREVGQADYMRLFRYWDPGLGLNLAEVQYDMFRALFYYAGLLAGFRKSLKND
jgi:glycosyltransferase involved in cell wall biosynthesis